MALRYIMVGGFLGAGKTTTLARLARHYTEAGHRVGIVTNDQAADLVDTHSLRAQGFDVGEVAGACFCCHFNELVQTVSDLKDSGECEPPDLILAEPVGSCTDLVATVLRPLAELHGGPDDTTDGDSLAIEIAPYCVILKPSHGQRILSGRGAGFSSKAAYILEKQLEEADAILINRVDELSPEQADELEALVRSRHASTPVLRVSARTGQGFEAVTELLGQQGEFGRRVLDIDYDTYAEGEAELGWLNASTQISRPDADAPFELDPLLLAIVSRLADRLAADGAEAAHLKTIGLFDGAYGVANLISSDTDPELSLPSRGTTHQAEVIINARVAIDPAVLSDHVDAVLAELSAEHSVAIERGQSQSFRPGRPEPTHRMA